MIVVGLLLRLIYIHAQGFPNDIAAFEAWAVGLVAHGPSHFYASTSFLDYPPGYLYILSLVGLFWTHLIGNAHDPNLAILGTLVKLPGVFFDLALGALIYALARRFASERVALGAAALYLINPAIIFVSALWGQVDSVSAFFALLAVYALLRSEDFAGKGAQFGWTIGGWLAFAYSLLIKPQAAVLLPLLIAFALTADRANRRRRVECAAAGIVAAILLTIALVEPFHPSNPAAALSWLVQRLQYGTNVYPYNSVNAFNLWALHVPWKSGPGSFWQPDSQLIGIPGTHFGMSEGGWGILLVVVAIALVVWRYVQIRTAQALVEGGALALLAFFILATRMHERYIFDGVVFTIACLPFARRYLTCALILTLVFWFNLLYSYQYIALVTSHASSGANPYNLWGSVTTVLAVVNVVVFFYLGYVYLGSQEESAALSDVGRAALEFFGKLRRWFDPAQGLQVMQKSVDYVVATSFGVASFILSAVFPRVYWRPAGNECWPIPGAAHGVHCGIFDEVYFARAAEEYLKNMRIYENTHPPLSKLLITFSTMLFGGLQHGDNPAGWRFLDVLFGALVVVLLYIFAKRVTGSTIWASVATGFFLFDGMHYVQSRIATPEGFVIFFSLAACYAFYRFWIASQTTERPHIEAPPRIFALGAAVSILCGIAAMLVFDVFQHAAFGWPWFVWWMGTDVTYGPGPLVVCSVYFALGFYLLFRYVVLPRLFAGEARETTFADGSYALVRGKESEMHVFDGGIVGKGKPKRGELTQSKGAALVFDNGEATTTYARDRVRYATPAGTATYAGARVDTAGRVEDGTTARRWLILFTLALGTLVSLKWYGVMGFGVSFVLLILISLQRYVRWPIVWKGRPALWGNPRGYRLDGALVTIAFVALTVYGLVWIPDLARQAPDPNEIHNVNDVVLRQYSMYDYHSTLKAKHPYSSLWYQWPFDYVPVAYYYDDERSKDLAQPDPNKRCCIYEITSMPNPFTLWFGLLAVPIVAVLAWRERNKGYALLIVTYLLQWLPWAKSPRLAWEYHFYVNIPLICLCNAIVLQRVWAWSSARGGRTAAIGRVAVVAVACVIVAAFIFFFPILSAWPISYNAWQARMWFPSWIIGPYG